MRAEKHTKWLPRRVIKFEDTCDHTALKGLDLHTKTDSKHSYGTPTMGDLSKYRLSLVVVGADTGAAVVVSVDRATQAAPWKSCSLRRADSAVSKHIHRHDFI